MEASSHTYGIGDIGSQSLDGELSHRVVGEGTAGRATVTVAYLVPSSRSERGKVVRLSPDRKKTSVDQHDKRVDYTECCPLPPSSE